MTPAEGKKQRRALLRDIAKDARRAARAKLVALRVAIKDARAARRQAIASARQRCKDARDAARARAREMRARAVAEMRAAVAAERAAARSTCDVTRSDARARGGDKLAIARAELDAERAYRRDMKRIEAGNRASRRRAPAASSRERRHESDGEVAGNIPPEFVALWERVKRGIKGSARVTRTEAFLQYAHENPGEVLEVLEDKTDALVRELEAEQRQARRDAHRRTPPPGVSLGPAPF